MRRTRMVGAGLLAALLLLLGAGCGDSDDGADAPADTEPAEVEEAGDDEAEEVDEAADAEVDCSEEALGEDEEFDFVAANVVEDGELGPACLAGDDEALVDTWDVLAAIVPPDELASLSLFAGFDGGDEGDEVTVAFVNLLDEPGAFQMSVNLDEAEEYPEEAALTIVHEFGHVLTQTEDQLDTSVAPEDCTTFYNGDGCFIEGSLMDEWIQAFWGDEAAEVDPTDTSVEGGEERCALDDGFFGPYAASAPEEDFAEALSAYVFQVPAETDGQQERLDFFESYPDLVAQRDNAEAAGYGPVDNQFDPCGTG